jgi:hypothetical protein
LIDGGKYCEDMVAFVNVDRTTRDPRRASLAAKIIDRPMHLNTVQEIERAIDALTPQQMEELYAWLDQRHPQPIDAQLRTDLDAGRIDDRIHRALADHKAGNTQRL